MLLIFCYWFLVRFHCVREYTLWFQLLVEACFMTENKVCLGKCSMNARKKLCILLPLDEMPCNVNEIFLTDGTVQFFYILVKCLHSHFIHCSVRNIKVPDCNCGLVYVFSLMSLAWFILELWCLVYLHLTLLCSWCPNSLLTNQCPSCPQCSPLCWSLLCLILTYPLFSYLMFPQYISSILLLSIHLYG